MNTIEIEDESPRTAIYYFIGCGIFIIMGVFVLVDTIRFLNQPIKEGWWRILTAILMFLVGYLCFYLGEIARSYRKLKLTDQGFHYIFKDKLKEKLLWTEINRIEIKKGYFGSMYNIFIYGTQKRGIEEHFPGTKKNEEKLRSMLQLIKKYKSQYKFVIETYGL